MRGMPAGPTWHAAKIVECGGQCTTDPRSGGVFATIDAGGFTIEPLDPAAACTPTSVAAHMLYETVDPFQMREPAGTLQVREATYRALDERRVRVEGSRFEPADQHTIKLEGARISGYATMSFSAIRDPHILGEHRGLGGAAGEGARRPGAADPRDRARRSTRSTCGSTATTPSWRPSTRRPARRARSG